MGQWTDLARQWGIRRLNRCSSNINNNNNEAQSNTSLQENKNDIDSIFLCE
jgi:hypothetical protein